MADEARASPRTEPPGSTLTQAQREHIALQRSRALERRAMRLATAAPASAPAAASISSPSQGRAGAMAMQSGGRRPPAVQSNSGWQKDTGAGFFLEEQSEWDCQQAERGGPAVVPVVREQAPEAHPSYPAHPKCIDCSKEFFGSRLQSQFGLMVCDACHELHRDSKYSLITKTACKQDYLLTEADLGGQLGGEPALRFIEKPNRRNEKWSKVKLYLLCQVEELSFARYGGEAGLDAEFDRREESKKRKAVVKADRAMKKLRKDTLTSRWMASSAPHEHAYGAEVYNEEADNWSQTCACGHVRVYEKM